MASTCTKEHERERFDFLSQQQRSQPQQALSKEELTRLLEARRLKKEKTPEFQRQESWRYVRIHEPWRKPKGVDSHMRLSVRGWPALVKIGYRVPKLVRGLHPSGYRDVLVHNLAELETLSRENDAARLAAGVGRRKRIEIAKRAKELGIRVLNGRGLLLGQKVGETAEAESDETKEEKESAVSKEATKAEETTPARKLRAKKKKQAKKPKSKKKPTKKKAASSKKKPKKKKSSD
jgi:large subunit ribosomal protein L32e